MARSNNMSEEMNAVIDDGDEFENVEDLSCYYQSDSLVKHLKEYVRLIDNLANIASASINKINECYDRNISLDSNILKADQVLQNLMTIINNLPKCYIDELVNSGDIPLCCLTPREAARQIVSITKATMLSKDKKFVCLSDHSKEAHREFLSLITDIVSKSPDGFRAVTIRDIRDVVNTSSLRWEIDDEISIEIDERETHILTDEGETLLYTYKIGHEHIAFVIKDNQERFITSAIDGDLHDNKRFSDLKWVELLRIIERLLSKISIMTQKVINVRKEIDLKKAMKSIDINFSISTKFDSKLRSMVKDIDMMVTSAFAGIVNDWVNHSSTPSVSEFDLTALNTMGDFEFVGTLANIDHTLRKYLDGQIKPSKKVFRYKN